MDGWEGVMTMYIKNNLIEFQSASAATCNRGRPGCGEPKEDMRPISCLGTDKSRIVGLAFTAFALQVLIDLPWVDQTSAPFVVVSGAEDCRGALHVAEVAKTDLAVRKCLQAQQTAD